MKTKIFILMIGIIFSLNFVLSDVGVGISPSTLVLQVEGGKVMEYNLLVFNTGDDPIKLNFGIDGEIMDFTIIEEKDVFVDPEPKPHELPIKNGKMILVRFTPPATMKQKTYEGTIAVTGSPAGDASFGGSVGVATKVNLIVTPTKTFLNYLTLKHYIIIGAIIILALVIWLLKRAGFSVSFKKKKK